MKYKISALCFALAALCVSSAGANWEPRPVYIDDGGRMTLSLRGGFAYGMGKIKNELGAFAPELYVGNPTTGQLMTLDEYDLDPLECPGCVFLGSLDLGDLPANKNMRSFGWASAVAVGFTVPNSPQWRMEANWDHIGEVTYSSTPMFAGDLTFSSGLAILPDVAAGGVYSKLSSEIITAMIYYDFFNGCVKPRHSLVPYIGFGFGYASSRTILELTDSFGNLSIDESMQPFGEPSASGQVLEFYTSKTITGNIAGALALGFSYGLMEYTYLDFGIRALYIPRIDWALNNHTVASTTGDKSKQVFSATNVIYANALIGLRFEF